MCRESISRLFLDFCASELFQGPVQYRGFNAGQLHICLPAEIFRQTDSVEKQEQRR